MVSRYVLLFSTESRVASQRGARCRWSDVVLLLKIELGLVHRDFLKRGSWWSYF